MHKEAILLDSGLPSGVLCDQVAKQGDHVVARQSDLLGCVQLSHCHRVVLESALVDGDREGDAALICTSVPLANCVRAVVDFAGDAGADEKFF